jgi:hypothetical protein
MQLTNISDSKAHVKGLASDQSTYEHTVDETPWRTKATIYMTDKQMVSVVKEKFSFYFFP